MTSFEMVCNVAPAGTDVSAECIASIIRVTRFGKLGMLAVTGNVVPKRRYLQEPHDITSKKTAFSVYKKQAKTPWPLVRMRTIPTERHNLSAKFSTNFCGKRGVTWSARQMPHGR
jgi:hypothetical protein